MAVDNILNEYTGPNPFSEAQAKVTDDSSARKEFFATSTYWDRFNEQHEILLGTRGSGKTMILKMLCYSNLRLLNDELAKKYASDLSFIGFYIPLHLEFMSALRGHDYPDEERCEYFQFAFNCVATDSFLGEVQSLLSDRIQDPRARAIAESFLVERLARLWFPQRSSTLASISDLRWEITVLFNRQDFWLVGSQIEIPPLAGTILAPIKAILATVSEALGLSDREITWIACVDEAEFLRPAFVRCINQFLRSYQRPIALKVATLPFKHSTRQTLVQGVSVEPNGNDFNYRVIDLDADSREFERLTDHMCQVRFKRYNLPFSTLAEFLGTIGNDEPIDYFRSELDDSETTDQSIEQGILSAISSDRRARFAAIAHDPYMVATQYIQKFRLAYYVRKVRKESKANRVVGWFAGARIVRKVADGNPRRFIQLMHDLVQSAMQNKLGVKDQHRVISAFAERVCRGAEGLPELGPDIFPLLWETGRLLEKRIHGPVMDDGGCSFTLSAPLCELLRVTQSIKVAVQYSHIVASDGTIDKIRPTTELRLSYVYAVYFWLPMRRGVPCVISGQKLPQKYQSIASNAGILSAAQASDLVKQLQLNLGHDDE